MKKIRVDKWLWTVRLFKSRSLATEQCKKGKITLDNAPLKASYHVEPGQTIGVQKNGFNLLIQINTILPNRVSASLAAPCYTDLTSEEEKNKYNAWYIGKGRPEMRERGAGRPTKKERRELDDFKTSAYNNWLLGES
jgi:ribosome-associated heat shock protein Hsp15